MSGEICCANVWPAGAFRSHPCRAKAKVERDGKWYCGRHDPVLQREKYDKKEAARIAESNAFSEQRRKAAAVVAERDLKAALYPELLEALQKIMAIEDRLDCGDWDEINDAREIARAAIARATGETPCNP